MPMSTNIRSRARSEAAESPSGSWTRRFRPAVPGARWDTTVSAVPQDVLDHIGLRRFDKSHDLPHPAAFETGQRVGPGLRVLKIRA